MKKNLDQWEHIADLIAKEKETALAEFRKQEFDPKARPEIRFSERPLRLLVLRPVFMAVAASVILFVALVSFWLLRGSWQNIPAASALNEILADSFLYGWSGRPVTERGADVALDTAAPLFKAWAAAAMERLAAAESTGHAAAIDPEASVEHVDPEQVRRRIGRAIQEGAFEQLLRTMREIHNKEA